MTALQEYRDESAEISGKYILEDDYSHAEAMLALAEASNKFREAFGGAVVEVRDEVLKNIFAVTANMALLKLEKDTQAKPDEILRHVEEIAEGVLPGPDREKAIDLYREQLFNLHH